MPCLLPVQVVVPLAIRGGHIEKDVFQNPYNNRPFANADGFFSFSDSPIHYE